MTNEQLSSFLLFSENQDMAAINRYIDGTPAVTPEAVRLKDDWIRWWDQLGWWEKNVSTEAYDEARNRRNKFFLANAPSKAEKEAVIEVITQGVTTEEMEGATRRADSSGMYPEPPLVSTSTKVTIGLGIGLGVVGTVALLISKYNPAALAAKLAAKVTG